MRANDQPARFSIEALTRPKATSLAVLVTLQDFAITTFAVDPKSLAQYLPPDFSPEVRRLSNGTERAFVSAVTFLDVDFRLHACQWPRFSFGQTNYRSYVIHKGQRVGWFFGTALATPFVLVPQNLWKLPWHRAQMQFSTEWKDNRCIHYEEKTVADGANAELVLTGTSEPTGCLDGFFDDEDTEVVLTHPLIAYYQRRDGKIGTYGVWHEKLHMQRAIAHKASFEVFERLGLTTPESKPHSVLIQRSTDFTILLPPKQFAPAD